MNAQALFSAATYLQLAAASGTAGVVALDDSHSPALEAFFALVQSLLILLFLLLFAALFSALETAALSANRHLIRARAEEGDPAATRALRLLANTHGVVAASVAGILISLLLSVGMFHTFFIDTRDWILAQKVLPGSLAFLASPSLWTLIILPPIFLIASEFIPRRWCRNRPDALLAMLRGPLYPVISWWVSSTGWLARVIAFVLNLVGLRGGLEPLRITREDLHALVAEPDSAGPESTQLADSVDTARRRMIRSILSIRDTLVREVMRPIGEVVAVRIGDMTPRQLLDFSRALPYTRYPVYRDRLIDFIGWINLYDVLSDDTEGKRIEEYLREALFVPETAPVDMLLREFVRQKTQCAIVFDEHGTCSGWVTREDVLNQIVGNMTATGDPALALVRQTGPDTFEVDPRIDVDDLNRVLDVHMEKNHCETVRGFIYARLGRVPQSGERIVLRNYLLEVAELDRHVVRKVILHRRPVEAPAHLQ